MALVIRLCFYCWWISFMIQRSVCYPAAQALSSESLRQKMTSREIAHPLWKRGDLKVLNDGKNQTLSAKNDKDVIRFRKENDFDVDGTKISQDRYRGKRFPPDRYMMQRMNSEGRGRLETSSLLTHSRSNHDRAETEQENTVFGNVDHMIDETAQRKLHLGFDVRGKTDYKNGDRLLHGQFNNGVLKTLRELDYSCGPNKSCSCQERENYVYVNCDGWGIMEFPTSLPLDAKIIDLSYNKISNLFLASIRFYPLLARLSLAHNFITNVTDLPDGKKIFQIKYLDLSYNNLINIPDLKLLSGLETLSLSNNHIFAIERTSFLGMETLNVLDMSHNDIQRIDETAFDSLVNLKHFKLNSNANLGYSNKILSARLFEKLVRLEVLWMQNNTNRKVDKTYPNKALGKLINLLELAIDGLGKGAELGEELKNLPYLNRLMIGYRGNCYIETIPPNFFNNVENLTSLIFSGCNFSSDINPEAFQKLRKLEEYVITFPGSGYRLHKAFQDLEGLLYTNVTSLGLEGFGDIFEQCRTLSVNDTKYIRQMNLTKLNLNNNYFSKLDYDSLKYIPKTVETLLFRCSKFAAIGKRWSSFQNFTMLREIDVRDQNVNCSTIVDNQRVVQSLPHLNSPFASPVSLPGIDDDSSYDTFEENQLGCANFEQLCKERQSWEPFSKSKCDPGDLGTFCVPPNLRVVKASGFNQFGQALLSRKLSPNKFCYLDFSRGFYTTWGKGTIPQSVQVADLGDNFCKTIRSETFHANNSLRYLCIQNNYLGQAFADDVNGRIFSQLKHLKYLNIARNGIYNLYPQFFKGLKSLEVLKMMENRLGNLALNFLVMPKLRYIDLSDNSINWISRQSRQQLDALAKDHDVHLDLSFNPLPCTCSGIEVLQWLIYSKVKIKRWKFLKCRNENGKIVSILDMSGKLRALRHQCIPNTNLIITSCFCCALFFIVFVAGLLYKHRWKLIYARNIWLVKLFGFWPAREASSVHAYDAYVVYCQEDTDFALDTMIEEMEIKRGHRLCVEDRDFIPGSFNFNSITCAIINSTITILLLSPEFVRNKDMEYATQMALMEQYNSQTKRQMILLLCYREVPDSDMPKDLLLLMKKGRFLDYPVGEDDSVEERFWDRLSEEIGHNRSTNHGSILET